MVHHETAEARAASPQQTHLQQTEQAFGLSVSSPLSPPPRRVTMAGELTTPDSQSDQDTTIRSIGTPIVEDLEIAPNSPSAATTEATATPSETPAEIANPNASNGTEADVQDHPEPQEQHPQDNHLSVGETNKKNSGDQNDNEEEEEDDYDDFKMDFDDFDDNIEEDTLKPPAAMGRFASRASMKRGSVGMTSKIIPRVSAASSRASVRLSMMSSGSMYSNASSSAGVSRGANSGASQPRSTTSSNKWADIKPPKNRRQSSLDMRKLPTDILLMPSTDHADFDDDDDEDFDLDDLWHISDGGMSSVASGGGGVASGARAEEITGRQSSFKSLLRISSATSFSRANSTAQPRAGSMSTTRTSVAAQAKTSISAVDSGTSTVVAGNAGNSGTTTSAPPTKLVDKADRGLSAATATTAAASSMDITNETLTGDGIVGHSSNVDPSTPTARHSQQQPQQQRSLWQRVCCFNSRYTLKTQFMLSFGMVNALAVILVVVTCIVVAWRVGENVKHINQEAFVSTLGKQIQATTVKYLAEGIQQQFMPTNLIDIVSEATKDRFVGYPDNVFYYNLDPIRPIFENATTVATNIDTNDTMPIEDTNATQRRRIRESAITASIQQRQQLRERQLQLIDELRSRRRRHLQDEIESTSGSNVPYRDFLSGNNIYPTIGPELYLEWEVPSYVNETNFKEHVQSSRWESFFKSLSAVSTETALFIMQGACDPTDINIENCTNESNDVVIGGTEHPTSTTYPIYQGGRDLVPILKSIHESKEEIKNMGVYFANQGAGAAVVFPALPITINGRSSEVTTYESIGCDWMREANPVDPTLGPIGTDEEIERCREAGTVVSNRYYNALERAWCRDQALRPEKTIVSVIEDAWSNNWLLGVGRALYDRSTNAFVGCTYMSVSLDLAGKKLRESLFSNSSALSLVLHDEAGTVIASTIQNTEKNETAETSFPRIDELSVGVSQKFFEKVYSIFDDASEQQMWDPAELRQAYESCFANHDGYYVTAAPIPSIPDEYDPDYKPEFLVFMSTSESDVLPGVNQLNESVNEQVKKVFVFSLLAGIVGLGATTLVIMFMSNALTAPLRYINDAADEIVDNFGETAAKYKTPGAALLQASIDSIQYVGGRLQDSFAKFSSMRSLASKHFREEATNADGDEDEDDVDVEKFKSILKNTSNNRQHQSEKVDSSEKATETKLITSTGWCTPKTELTDVLQEFNAMVANFSGSLMSSSEKGKRMEITNRFPLRKEFSELYASRSDDIKDPNAPKFKYQLQLSVPAPRGSFAKEVSNMVGFIHKGSNMVEDDRFDESTKNMIPASNGAVTFLKKRFSSRLFLWTVALIVTPLLVTTVTISTFVMSSVQSEFGRSVENAKAFYQQVRLDAMQVHATLRADYVAGQLESGPIKDLYLTTRYYGWLFFGGVTRSNSFTEMLNGAEQCKEYAKNIADCPYMRDERLACDCSWNDDRFRECKAFPGGSRHLQVAAFSCESSMADPVNGDRNVTGYPDVAFSPETTEWWDDVLAVPGWERGSDAAGHETLYDRLRVASAMPLYPVLHNADMYKESYIASYFGLEADGAYMGYSGCNVPTPIASASWVSTIENRGPLLRPELCPEGKHGYDPRCRSWYDTGRRLALEEDSTLHITAPYVFAISKINAQSATSPLIDPKTGEHVGQVLQDFQPKSQFDALHQNNTQLSDGGFPILIAVRDDGLNTILGPNFPIGQRPQSILDVVLPNDTADRCNTTMCQDHRTSFRHIETSMTKGISSVDGFTRGKPTTGDEGVDFSNEEVFVAYHPVEVRSLRPVDASDFARGVEPYHELIYSLGLCEPAESLFKPFRAIEVKTHRQIKRAVSMLAVMILVASLFVVYISYLVTASITGPIIYLLDLIRRINRTDFRDGGPPKIKNSMMGSLELANVSDTVIILYKVVRAANEFFYSGELEMAYKVLKDALKLFRRLNNNKAVAVASNNLGNTLLVMYREMVADNLVENKLLKLSKKDIIIKGTRYYHDAIQLGEKAYDEFYETEGWTPNCLDFMQHLSNRYFNRALFLLSIKDDHDKPDEIGALGIRDLEISRDMDYEIVEYGADIGFNRVNRAEKLFTVNLIRSRGHNILLEMGYPDDKMLEHGYPEDWDLENRLNENFQLLQTEYKRRACSPKLFQDVTVLGRLQEVETVLMRYKLLMGDVECAAKIAIRMLQEDEFAFADSISQAIEVLVAYVDVAPASCPFLPKSMSRNKLKHELVACTEWLEQEMSQIKDKESESLRSSSYSNASSLSLFTTDAGDGSRLSSKFGGNSLRRLAMLDWINKQAAGGFVTMEDF